MSLCAYKVHIRVCACTCVYPEQRRLQSYGREKDNKETTRITQHKCKCSILLCGVVD